MKVTACLTTADEQDKNQMKTNQRYKVIVFLFRSIDALTESRLTEEGLKP